MRGLSTMRLLTFSLLFLVFLCFFGVCVSSTSGNGEIVGDTIDMRHSSLLSIVDCDAYAIVDVKNPWNKSNTNRYILLPKENVVPVNLPSGVVLRVPLERSLVFSGVHASLFEEFNAVNSIAGVCDARYMYCSAVKEGIATGAVVDCGSSLNIDSERVMLVNPDAVFVLPYENGGYGKLENMKYPLVECADYMEKSPLGCAEWMRFYGRLLGKAAESDSLFNEVCSEYERVAGMVEECDEYRPKLLCELKSSSAWYVPGGESTSGVLYKDAGADYLFADNKVSGSVPLSYEYVLDRAGEADIWLIKYNRPVDISLSSLLDEFRGYSHFKPYKEGMIFGCNTHDRNIFEDTSFHPEKLLKDLVSLFHPSLLPEYKTEYYEKIH